ncbi:ubiquinol-cytochrome reductase complex family protein [Salix suchowensis]|nr:ubiquinol-cytochrome reductase complex family protein [Salix suchowensis]
MPSLACVNLTVFASPTPNQEKSPVCLTELFSSNICEVDKGKADEEPVDPKKYLEETCKPKCVRPLLEYQACVKRIQDDESGHKHCTGQYFDYWSCVDKCVAPKLFSKLK